MTDVHLKTLKILKNPLLCRRQLAVEITHPSENPSRSILRELLRKKYKVNDVKSILIYGCKTAFGGGRTNAFVLLYNSPADAKRFELKHRLLSNSIIDQETKSGIGRRSKKEVKNRRKRFRGKAKANVKTGKK
eukprot:GHVN01045301.1.p1 GENE.GHVN01045301.1~~GHVN01045301.1.p1  ORF type:complete len:133 (+),score=20.35 GHVN01045301.1:64-462(+)